MQGVSRHSRTHIRVPPSNQGHLDLRLMLSTTSLMDGSQHALSRGWPGKSSRCRGKASLVKLEPSASPVTFLGRLPLCFSIDSQLISLHVSKMLPHTVQVGTPRTHRKYLGREDGTYGPIPSRRPLGMLSMPMNTTSIPGLYCVGDSTFPGQVRVTAMTATPLHDQQLAAARGCTVGLKCMYWT